MTSFAGNRKIHGILMEKDMFDFSERDGVTPNPISPGFTPYPSGDHPESGRKWYRKAAHR
jgi:hypothetical protein